MVPAFGACALMLSVAAPPAVRAADSATAPLPAPKGWQRTGQYENCLTVNRIRSSRILNKHQILFEMSGKEAYLAEPPPGQCPGLRRTYALSYDATINQLCNNTIVHLIEPAAQVPQRGACGIDRFEKLTKSPTAD